MVRKLSSWSGNFLDGLETFQMVWKLSECCNNFPGGLETFWMVWILYGWSWNFPNSLETFRMVWKLSGWSGNFPDSLENFRMVWNRVWRIFGYSNIIRYEYLFVSYSYDFLDTNIFFLLLECLIQFRQRNTVSRMPMTINLAMSSE